MGQGASTAQIPPPSGAKPQDQKPPGQKLPEQKSEQKGQDNEESADLGSVPTETLLSEVQRRLDCLNKPDKRIILVGQFTDPAILVQLSSCRKSLSLCIRVQQLQEKGCSACLHSAGPLFW